MMRNYNYRRCAVKMQNVDNILTHLIDKYKRGSNCSKLFTDNVSENSRLNLHFASLITYYVLNQSII